MICLWRSFACARRNGNGQQKGAPAPLFLRFNAAHFLYRLYYLPATLLSFTRPLAREFADIPVFRRAHLPSLPPSVITFRYPSLLPPSYLPFLL